MTTRFAEILLPFGNAHTDRLFTYEVPPELQEKLSVGDPVLVPFRSATASGFVVGFSDKSERLTKAILAKEEKVESISRAVLEQSRWLGNRYLSSWWDALRGFVVYRGKTSTPQLPVQSGAFSTPLTDEQEVAATAVKRRLHQGGFEVFLLHGITGSGKTEVYLSCVQECLKLNKEVLILVPEIPLSFQTAKRFKEVFLDQVIVLNSSLTEKEKRQEQSKLQQGLSKVVIGPRMALFAPFHNLGLIIIDEEHDSSYKQESQPRYHACALAKKLAQDHDAALLLGSATPSLESFHAAEQQEIKLLTLESRFESRALPAVHVIDMRGTEIKRPLPFSFELLEALNDTLKTNQQAILFLNRRGFSPLVLCRDCGHTFKCPNCSITLTFHVERALFRCHYCDYQHPVPSTCPKCQSSQLSYRGFGTQRLEEELRKHFPNVKSLRLDRDTSAKRGAVKEIVDRFTQGEAQVLIGTQMVTKGFHFPNVNLVGVLHSDHLLNFPDFRAAEKTFQLLTQVAGRAGRGLETGRAIFQTYNPEHVAVQAAAHHDYRRFYKDEIQNRKNAVYPPFTSLANVLLAGEEISKVEEAAAKVGEYLKRSVESDPEIQMLGPAPCPIERINKNFRWHSLLKCKNVDSLTSLGSQLYAWYGKEGSKKIRLTIDIDPLQLL